MAINAINLISGNSTSAATSATTASIFPSPNRLTIVAVTGSTAQVPTVTGASGTWVLIGSQFDGGGLRGVHMFRDLSATPGSGALTIDFNAVSQNFIGWSVEEFLGTDLSGTHGSGAIAQFAGTGTNSGTTTGITATLAALGSTENAAYGYVRNNNTNAIVKGTNFIQLSNSLAGEVAAEWGINQTAVNWTWASQTLVSVALAIEIKAAGTTLYFAAINNLYQTSLVAASQTLSGLNGGFGPGYNERLVIPTSQLTSTYTGGGYISVTISFYQTTTSGTLDEMWIGHQGITQVYNFDGNQIQLKFNGGAISISGINGAVSYTSDRIGGFIYQPTKPLIVSSHLVGTTVTGLANTTGPTNCNQYLLGASQAGATAPTGTWSQDSIWTFVSNITLYHQ